MDHPGDIGETLAWTRGQRLFGPLRGGLAEELRHRLALDSGRSPDLLVKFGIKPKASHVRTVSHLCLRVIHARGPCRGRFIRSPRYWPYPCHGLVRAAPADKESRHPCTRRDALGSGCGRCDELAATVMNGGAIAVHGAQDRRSRDSGHDADACWVEQFDCTRGGSGGRLPPACDHEQLS